MRVLVIDDDTMVRKTVRKMLEKGGHQVADAENGRFGLERLAQEPCDLVLTDIIMPELEGLELLMTVAKQYPETRIIAMSGSFRIGHIDFLEFAARLGASATLHKPFTQETLLGAIEQSMGATRTA